MKIIEPAVELITEPNPFKRIELCGRVCYKSESKITEGSAKKFVEMVIKRGHTSVLEHSRVMTKSDEQYGCEGINDRADIKVTPRDEEGQSYFLYKINMRDLYNYEIDINKYNDAKYNANDYATVRITCDRAIANELVRHRVFSCSQESTRYVKYNDVKFIKPIPFEWAKDEFSPRFEAWKHAMSIASAYYRTMIEKGSTPQEARNVLPLSTATELIMTGTYDQWREMLKLRRHKSAHPQMQYIANMIHDLLVKECEFTM